MTKEELEKENADLKKAYNETEELLDKQTEETYKLFKKNAELKEKLKPENCLKLLAKEGYIKFTSDQLNKAKEIIKKMLYEYQRLCLIKKETITEVEQFLKGEL